MNDIYKTDFTNHMLIVAAKLHNELNFSILHEMQHEIQLFTRRSILCKIHTLI